MEEIERNRKIVRRLRNSATAIDIEQGEGSPHARVSLLERLEARKTKGLHLWIIKQPEIVGHADEVFDAEVSKKTGKKLWKVKRKSELGDANAKKAEAYKDSVKCRRL